MKGSFHRFVVSYALFSLVLYAEMVYRLGGRRRVANEGAVSPYGKPFQGGWIKL